MEAKDVRNLPWKKVTDWSELSASHNCYYGMVCEEDVNIFVENIFRDIARKLNIPYEQLKPILENENKAFYSLKKRIYRTYCGYKITDNFLIQLQNTLRVPDTSNIEVAVALNNVSACLKLFEGLSDIEKLAFLKEIGKINVKIEHFTVQTEETKVESHL